MDFVIMLGLGAALCLSLALLWRQRAERRRAATLLEVSLRLGSTIKRKELLELIMTTTARTLQAEGSSVLLLDEEKEELYFEVATGEKHDEVKQIRLKASEGVAGWVASNGQPVLINDPKSDARWSNRVSTRVQVPTRNMLCVPVRSNGKLLGVLQVINKQGARGFNRKELRLLEMIASPAAIALENMLLYEALAKSMEELRVTTAVKERMESEMKIARDIQRSFLPEEHLRMGHAELCACLIPAREVGGDFYHYMKLDEHRLLICLGDVSDKGMPAALFMSGLMIWIKAKADTECTPAEMVDQINRELSTDDSTMFATILLAVYDVRTGELTYCNGGHCPPIHLSKGKAVAIQSESSLPVGIFADTIYRNNVLRVTEGDCLILYTDGITEAENGQGEWFGFERLRRAAEESADAAPLQLNQAIYQSVLGFCNGYAQTDDIAVMTLRINEKSKLTK